MKTDFMKIDDHWVVKTGKVVVVDTVTTLSGNENIFLSDQVVDICTGQTFAIEEEKGVLKLIEYEKEMPEYQVLRRGNRKRIERANRVNELCGVHWPEPYKLKRIGKNRKMARIMWPNQKQLKEYREYLPF